MKDSDSRSSRHYRKERRSVEEDRKDRERGRDRNRSRHERDRIDRDREREKTRERDRYHDRDRSYDKDYRSRHYRSKTPSAHSYNSHSKESKIKKSKKYKHRSSSSDDSSQSSDFSYTSKDSRLSSTSRSSRTSKKSSTRSRRTRTNSSDGNSSSLPATVSIANTPNPIDINDLKVKAALEVIEEDDFIPKTFYSSRDREAPAKIPTSEKVIIDLNTETVSLPKPQNIGMETKDEIINPNFLGDLQQKNQRWIKKLFIYRQKCFRE